MAQKSPKKFDVVTEKIYDASEFVSSQYQSTRDFFTKWTTDFRRGMMTNMEVIDVNIQNPQSKIPTVGVYMKGFSFFDPQYNLKRFNDEGTTKFNLFGCYGQITNFAPTDLSEKGIDFANSKTAYYYADKIKKITSDLSTNDCYTIGIALTTTRILIPFPSMWPFSNENNEIEKTTRYKLKTPPTPPPTQYSPKIFGTYSSEHLFGVECSYESWFQNLLDYTNHTISNHFSVSPWLLKFLKNFLAKNIEICKIKTMIDNDQANLNKSEFKQLCEEYCVLVKELNNNFIYKYYPGLGYIYMNYFANVIKFPSDTNVTIPFFNNFLYPNVFLDSAQKYYDESLGEETMQKLVKSGQITDREAQQIITMEKKEFPNELLGKIKHRTKVSGLFFGTSFMFTKLINVWYQKKRDVIFQKYPERKNIIELIGNEIAIHPSFKHFKYMNEVLSDKPMSEDRMEHVFNLYKINPTYRFLPTPIDYSISTVIYTYFSENLFIAMKSAYLEVVNKDMDQKDRATDVLKKGIFTSMSLSAVGAAITAMGMYLVPNLAWSVLEKGYENAKKILSNSPDLITQMSFMVTKDMTDVIKAIGLGIVGVSFPFIIRMLGRFIYWMSPFFMVPIIARAIAAVRLGSGQLYNKLKHLKSSPSPSPSSSSSSSSSSIGYGKKIFNKTLKEELKKEVLKDSILIVKRDKTVKKLNKKK